MCGEHRNVTTRPTTTRGSSPRVRGTRASPSSVRLYLGIIPACAGNTVSRSRFVSLYRDHPRVCGEHRFCHARRIRASGSSPRVRGTHHVGNDAHGGVGIIPACAGNTVHLTRLRAVLRDHPRVCGEHRYGIGFDTVPLGSSPRVRGTPKKMLRLMGQPGIIPACAGNTRTPPQTLANSRDHPRVCGEHYSTYASYRI